MSERRDCPFCGPAGSVMWSKSEEWCDGCDARVPHGTWDKRPIEDALQAELANLKAENARLTREVSDLTAQIDGHVCLSAARLERVAFLAGWDAFPDNAPWMAGPQAFSDWRDSKTPAADKGAQP